jgi:hypothetical protein
MQPYEEVLAAKGGSFLALLMIGGIAIGIYWLVGILVGKILKKNIFFSNWYIACAIGGIILPFLLGVVA